MAENDTKQVGQTLPHIGARGSSKPHTPAGHMRAARMPWVQPANVFDALVQLFRGKTELVEEVLTIVHDPVDIIITNVCHVPENAGICLDVWHRAFHLVRVGREARMEASS